MSEFHQVLKEGATEVKRKTWRITKRILLIMLSLGIIIGAVLFWFNYAWTYSDGTRAGTLIKVSNKGYIFKTYEGQLNTGGFQTNPQGSVISNIWEFSVTKKDIYQQLQRYEGKEAILFYKQYRRALPWQGKTTYFVYKIEPVR
ncbi:MAG TPA: hypothetical protein PKD70_12645 [Saprospiraceae bacterium]|nr:hypothetical protein [Saprospiraceae bacterium]